MNNDTPQPTVEESLTVQKPRCPWPVHEWHPNAAYCSVDCGSRLRLFDKDDYCVEIRDFKTAIETQWTRAEALASQMLTAPDKPGVWAIYLEGSFYKINYYNNFKKHNHPDFPNQKNIIGRCDWDNNSVFRFYYMGPLPTAESEVCHE